MNTTNKIASPGARFVAYLVDALIYPVVFAAFVYLGTQTPKLYQFGTSVVTGAILTGFIATVGGIVNNGYLVSIYGASLGKLATGLRIVRNDGPSGAEASGKISFWRALWRNYAGYAVSAVFFYLGFVWILVDKRERRAWHDYMANTRVVSVGKSGVWMGLGAAIALMIVLFFLLGGIKANLDNNMSGYVQEFNAIPVPTPTASPAPSPLAI